MTINSLSAMKNVLPTLVRTINTPTGSLVLTDRMKVVAVDTAAWASTLTLPASGNLSGDKYYLLDVAASWDVNPVTLASNTYYGTTQLMNLNVKCGFVCVTYRGGAVGWTVSSSDIEIDSTALQAVFDASLVRKAYIDPVVARIVATPTLTVANADQGTLIGIDTTANAVAITLPSTGLTVGDKFSFIDVKANWAAAPATLVSGTYYGTTQAITLDIQAGTAVATWRGLPIGWTIGNGYSNIDSSALNTLFSTRAPLANPALTGVPTAPTAAVGTNTTQLATTAFTTAAVAVESARAATAEALLASINSPALTGVPTTPTAAVGTNTTQIASTAFAKTAPLTAPQIAAGATGVAALTAAGVLVDLAGAVVTVGAPPTTSATWVVKSANYTITAADADATIACSVAVTITIPQGLTPRPSFFVLPPPSGSVTLAVSGVATLNGATVSILRNRVDSPVGVSVLAYPEVDAYGVA